MGIKLADPLWFNIKSYLFSKRKVYTVSKLLLKIKKLKKLRKKLCIELGTHNYIHNNNRHNPSIIIGGRIFCSRMDLGEYIKYGSY